MKGPTPAASKPHKSLQLVSRASCGPPRSGWVRNTGLMDRGETAAQFIDYLNTDVFGFG